MVQVRAAETHAIDTLKAAKLSTFASLIDLAGATAAFSNEKARVTLLAPTDEVRDELLCATAGRGLMVPWLLLLQ
jgi:hypothetical protein